MSWMKQSKTEGQLREDNIRKLESLRLRLKKLKDALFATQSGCYHILRQIADDDAVRGEKDIHSLLSKALKGENNQIVILDNPYRAKAILDEVDKLIQDKVEDLRDDAG